MFASIQIHASKNDKSLKPVQFPYSQYICWLIKVDVALIRQLKLRFYPRCQTMLS